MEGNLSFFGYLSILLIYFHITSRCFSSTITSIVKFRMTNLSCRSDQHLASRNDCSRTCMWLNAVIHTRATLEFLWPFENNSYWLRNTRKQLRLKQIEQPVMLFRIINLTDDVKTPRPVVSLWSLCSPLFITQVYKRHHYLIAFTISSHSFWSRQPLVTIELRAENIQ